MIQFFLVLVALCFGSVIAQHFIPPIPFLEGARVFLMPVIFFYAALALPYSLMLVLALVCGVMWDALIVKLVTVGTGAEAKETMEIFFGWSVAVYAALGSVMSGFRPLFRRGRWEVHCLASGLFVAVMVGAEFAFLSLRRAALEGAPFFFNASIGWRIIGAGLVATILAPFIFWLLNNLALLVGYDPQEGVEEVSHGEN